MLVDDSHDSDEIERELRITTNLLRIGVHSIEVIGIQKTEGSDLLVLDDDRLVGIFAKANRTMINCV